MDGVPGLTQPPIRPGESFTYEFTPPDAGTFWYHPHADSLQQLGRGLAGAFIVEEQKPVAVDRDLLWLIEDWRLDDGGRIAPGFGNRMEAGMSGRIGNTITVNGRVPYRVAVKAGERVRLRIVNAALARIVGLRSEGHRPVVISHDGQPCEPHLSEGGRLVLGPAMRADLIIDMDGKPGQTYRVIDDFYRDLAYKLVDLAYGPERPTRDHPPSAPPRLPANTLPEPDLTAAERHEIALQGGNPIRKTAGKPKAAPAVLKLATTKAANEERTAPSAPKPASMTGPLPPIVTLKHLAEWAGYNHGVAKKQAIEMFTGFVADIGRVLKKGSKTRIPNLGVLQVRMRPARPARKGRNPATGEEIRIKASKASKKVAFRVARGLSEAI